jgi:hypothetical protein
VRARDSPSPVQTIRVFVYLFYNKLPSGRARGTHSKRTRNRNNVYWRARALDRMPRTTAAVPFTPTLWCYSLAPSRSNLHRSITSSVARWPISHRSVVTRALRLLNNNNIVISMMYLLIVLLNVKSVYVILYYKTASHTLLLKRQYSVSNNMFTRI